MSSSKSAPFFATRLRVLANDDMVVLSFIDNLPPFEPNSSIKNSDSSVNEFLRVAVTPSTARSLKKALDAYFENHILEEEEEDDIDSNV